MRLLQFIIKAFKSSTLQFVFIRYLSYAVIFLNSLLLAKYHGIYMFGIYGFVLMFLQYFSYANLGVNHSLNTILALKKSKSELSTAIWENSLLISVLFSTAIIIVNFALLYFFPNILSKFEYAKYGIAIVFLGVVSNFNNLFLALYRIHSKFLKINFQLLAPQVVILFVLLFNSQVSIELIVRCMLITNLISLILFIYKSPLKLKLNYHKKIISNLLNRGISLLLYNMSYNFIMIASATLVSIFYIVSDFGQYKFAQTISSAIFMAAGAFSFVFYPKMLNRISTKNKEEVLIFIKEMKDIYIGALNFLSFTFLLIVPVILMLFPEYTGMLNVFKLLLIAQVFSNQSNVYKTYLISKREEKYLTYYGFLSIIIVVITGLMFSIYKLPFEFVALSVVLGSGFYSYMSIRKSLLFIGKSDGGFIKEILSYKLLIPLFIVLASILWNDNFVLPILSFLVYVILNISESKLIFKGFVRIVNDKRIIEF